MMAENPDENSQSIFEEQEAQYIEDQAQRQYQTLCDTIAKKLNSTLSVYNALFTWNVDELEIKWLVLKLDTYPTPTQFDVLKDGERVAWIWIRGGRVRCYFWDREKIESEEIYRKSYNNEPWFLDMNADFFTDDDLTEAVRLINEKLAK